MLDINDKKEEVKELFSLQEIAQNAVAEHNKKKKELASKGFVFENKVSYLTWSKTVSYKEEITWKF